MKIIDLRPDGEGRTMVTMGDNLVTLITRFNYFISCWTLDLIDSEEELILTGLMLIPGVDILRPYPQIKNRLGSLVLFEKSKGDYRSSFLLGTHTKLTWFEPGEPVVTE